MPIDRNRRRGTSCRNLLLKENAQKKKTSALFQLAFRSNIPDDGDNNKDLSLWPQQLI